MDRFTRAVGGIAFAAILTTAFLVASVWGQRDSGLYVAASR